jgi:hypothetical protein
MGQGLAAMQALFLWPPSLKGDTRGDTFEPKHPRCRGRLLTRGFCQAQSDRIVIAGAARRRLDMKKRFSE